ncbi:NAD(+)/NADH kinase [Actinoplanes sp. NPDC048796]|uniref:NAD(+)/NADH kinase n=1 Tax=Actinoplanes sp. NPDC048796 TaxID=3155640 RepID=UPI0033F41382
MGDKAVLGLVVHPSNDVSESVTTVVNVAARVGARVVARPDDAARLGLFALEDPDFVEKVDFVFSLGGDGTMLGAMRLMAGRPTPILGVNHGNLGFLIETSPADLPAALERLMAGEFSLEPHSALAVGDVLAFNDVVVTAATAWTSVALDLKLNGVKHGYFRCDAVVVCTPTGSTAYNYAAGGPIISPSVTAIGLTPVAPMSGISRPLVLGGTEIITLRGAAPSRVSLDGADTVTIDENTDLTVQLRPNAVNVVRFDRAAHERRTRVKLSLLDLPLRPDQLIELVPEHLRERVLKHRP